MNPLIKSLVTPQAAPESRRLARLRRAWMALSLLLAASVLGLQIFIAWLGPAGALAAAVLLPTWLVHTACYWRTKIRADEAWDKAGAAAPQQGHAS